ncbi:hypothetical protein E2C01_043945 [Portunus trituberculatus]|uniref:Uncharacterized protein n=1 Tax=Portunus trituberculatus TaxID=210409 RepID=A0A5B7FYM7_PORTR|nr:hypothetical protein [Portunus trituberculatus]
MRLMGGDMYCTQIVYPQKPHLMPPPTLKLPPFPPLPQIPDHPHSSLPLPHLRQGHFGTLPLHPPTTSSFFSFFYPVKYFMIPTSPIRLERK